ncbi:hypothetical protein GUITHDRAFT_110936 [Guillardia theta CCMP2712]|uniref:Uncharacterized protein n=2 Tax=Guillardia theta TaxID=55529 RepID=L1J4F8_GUITC|nr:hypothetical protein GUITHDRAFT_110936 [Guillardia theta CCMP2712]EKX43212.1 hypothetical protein GUITHDRAFT_110936 [Guillardia theta CCMP2712]|eukprot:XP_005830192.1 hypothetical protein GUITHDRAFT_110936 [Guillardia theta CCMP2712]
MLNCSNVHTELADTMFETRMWGSFEHRNPHNVGDVSSFFRMRDEELVDLLQRDSGSCDSLDQSQDCFSSQSAQSGRPKNRCHHIGGCNKRAIFGDVRGKGLFCAEHRHE